MVLAWREVPRLLSTNQASALIGVAFVNRRATRPH